MPLRRRTELIPLSLLLAEVEVAGISPDGVPYDTQQPGSTRPLQEATLTPSPASHEEMIPSTRQMNSLEAATNPLDSSIADDDSYDDNSRHASNGRWWSYSDYVEHQSSSYADYERHWRATGEPGEFEYFSDEESPSDDDPSFQEKEDQTARTSARRFCQKLEIVQRDIAASEECPICRLVLADSKEGGDPAVMMPCHTSHMFHTECIYSWMVEHPSCPYCRATFPKSCFETPSRDDEEVDDDRWGTFGLRLRG